MRRDGCWLLAWTKQRPPAMHISQIPALNIVWMAPDIEPSLSACQMVYRILSAWHLYITMVTHITDTVTFLRAQYSSFVAFLLSPMPICRCSVNRVSRVVIVGGRQMVFGRWRWSFIRCMVRVGLSCVWVYTSIWTNGSDHFLFS